MFPWMSLDLPTLSSSGAPRITMIDTTPFTLHSRIKAAILADIPENISIDAMYDFLQTNYQPKPKPQFPLLLKILSRLRLDNFALVSDYTHKFMSVESEMESMRPNGISRTVVNTIFLEGLGRKWEEFKQCMIEDNLATSEFTPMPLGLLVLETEANEALIRENHAPLAPPVTK
ncbi:transposon polyprotein reverse transcriptase [Penicillium cosmopolitanum]|uniref:Transposon polyprotein reverse transcriptase n=1 Tax=Penicillium cosmopolitanum TaxID=1131564 RepID=A0A9W9WAG0_9EURO|nr:transposon polyprotein reverse transcriptase [Penicillium cosmopolitanum]KAJ5413919.1 transposon polyprotein reverse transcriptase [Penicillium cosmopolitanum]